MNKTTDKQIKALKLALEALERCVATCFDQYAHEQVMSRPEHFVNQTITAVREALAEQPAQQEQYTYTSTQATMCAECGEHKHTPLRIDAMGGYVCLTCIDKKLGSLLGEFGYPQPAQPSKPLTDEQIAKEVEAELTHYWNGEYIDTTGARDQLTAFARAIEAAHGIKGDA